jgi:Ni/Fe-hydrogenase subunit HybB-like protein
MSHSATPVRNWLIACVAAILVAVATIVGAAVANGSWWYTYLSPFGMLAAAATTGLAMLFCGMRVGVRGENQGVRRDHSAGVTARHALPCDSILVTAERP